jgi:hypothetical protein
MDASGAVRGTRPCPHEPQASLRGHTVNPHVPQLSRGLCGNPRLPALKLMYYGAIVGSR